MPKALQKIDANLKTFMKWFWQVLARVRLADSHRISKPGYEI